MSDQDDYYQEHYKSILNEGSVGFVSNVIHKNIESNQKNYFDKVLEVGAGHGQHFEFLNHSFGEYFETDMRLENLPQRPDKSVIQLKIDAEDLSYFADNYIDRSIVSCLLLHLNDPESALRELRRVSKGGSIIDIYLPCEPGLILRILRNFTTVRKARRMGIDHLSFHYREHVTYFTRIDLLIREIYSNDSIDRKFWPLKVPFWNLNLAVFYSIKIA